MDFSATVCSLQEERRHRWTTYANINCWFDNWERDLVSLGFGTLEDGNVKVPEEQKARVLNLDESALHLDGNKKKRGGRPSVIFFDGALPVFGLISSKTSQSTTFIMEAMHLGKYCPPTFNSLQPQNHLFASGSDLRLSGS